MSMGCVSIRIMDWYGIQSEVAYDLLWVESENLRS